jgi:hypothetical protein
MTVDAEKNRLPPKQIRTRRIGGLEVFLTLEETMKLLATIVAIAALGGFAATQSLQVFAQAANAQIGASTSQGGAGGRGKSSAGVSVRGSASSGRSAGGHTDTVKRTGVRSETTHVSLGLGSKSETRIHGRSQTRLGLSSGSREDIVLRRKRANGVVVYNDEPERHVIIKKRRHPSIAIGETSRIVTRRHGAGDINIRTSVRSRETTGASAITVNRGQSSASKGSLRSQSTGQAHGSAGGNASGQAGSKASITTGQGSR